MWRKCGGSIPPQESPLQRRRRPWRIAGASVFALAANLPQVHIFWKRSLLCRPSFRKAYNLAPALKLYATSGKSGCPSAECQPDHNAASLAREADIIFSRLCSSRDGHGPPGIRADTACGPCRTSFLNTPPLCVVVCQKGGDEEMRNISKINFRDVQALNGLRLCGYALRSDLEHIISSNRVDTLLLRGYLESRTDIEGREVLTYTPEGKAFMRQIDSLKGRTFYPKQPNAVAHDTTLFHQYTRLSPAERMSATSETETRDRYHEALDKMRDHEEGGLKQMRHSIPDLVYTASEGETVAIEIVTSNYSHERIEQKEATAAAIGAEIQIIKI